MSRKNIEDIIARNRAGEISDEEMIDLLAQANEKNSTEEAWENPMNNFKDFLGSTFSQFMNFDLASMGLQMNASDEQNNTIQLSQFEKARGEDFEFRSNQIRMSTLGDLEMHQSKFLDNRLQGAQLEGFKLKDSNLCDMRISGSSLDQWALESSEILDCRVMASKAKFVRILGKSQMTDVKLSGVYFKSLCIEKESSILDTNFVTASMMDSLISASSFTDVQISTSAFNRASFENVQFADLTMKRCRFQNCSFKNIEVRSQDWNNIDFSNQDFDGNESLEQFLAQKRGQI